MASTMATPLSRVAVVLRLGPLPTKAQIADSHGARPPARVEWTCQMQALNTLRGQEGSGCDYTRWVVPGQTQYEKCPCGEWLGAGSKARTAIVHAWAGDVVHEGVLDSSESVAEFIDEVGDLSNALHPLDHWRDDRLLAYAEDREGVIFLDQYGRVMSLA